MADSKISALSAITALAATDEMVVASGGNSKKITGANLGASIALTTFDVTLGADVTIVSANTFVDGPSHSTPAGVYLVTWKALVKPVVTTSQSYWWTGKLWDGTTIYDEQEVTAPAAQNYNGWSFPVAGFAVITLGSTLTLKISVAAGQGSSASKISRDTVDNSGTSHTATRLTGIKIG